MRWVAVALCAVAALAALVAYRSERRADEVVRLSLVAVSGGPANIPDSAPGRARSKALGLLPSARLLNPDTNLDVQEGAFLERNPRRGEAILEHATDEEPENVFLWLALSQREERDGHLAAARRSYGRARGLDPRLPAPK
jgi:hypothetical protein